MINKIKTILFLISGIFVSIFLFAKKMKRAGKIEVRGKIEKANFKQIRKNMKLWEKVDKKSESEIDKGI